MARLTNERIKMMNDFEKYSYALAHPAEAPRIGNISAKTAGKCYGIAAKHSVGRTMDLVFGGNKSVIE